MLWENQLSSAGYLILNLYKFLNLKTCLLTFVMIFKHEKLNDLKNLKSDLHSAIRISNG